MLGTTEALCLLFPGVTLRNAHCRSPHLTAENAGPERVTHQLKLQGSTWALVPLDLGPDLRKAWKPWGVAISCAGVALCSEWSCRNRFPRGPTFYRRDS